MANSRIMLTCKHCGEQLCIGKGAHGAYYTVNKNMYYDLNEFYEKHQSGLCSDETDCSDDARNHFCIREEFEEDENAENKG